MARYIDADALMKEFRDFVRDSNNSDFAPVPNWNDAVSLVGSAPTADVVERKKGKWIDKPVYMQTMDWKTWDGFTHCSECKEMHEYGYRSNFCPNCGADMRKEEMSE